VRELFGQLDANDDKVIDPKEVPESGRTAFEQLLKVGDSNKNGKLELEEYRALIVVTMREDAAPRGPRSARQLMAMDKDDDGKVSKEEYKGPKPLFDRLDADKDGFITRKEAAAMRTSAPDAPPPASRPRPGPGDGPGLTGARFRESDKDGDGKISKEEFRGPGPMFDRLDADQDGFITKKDIAAMAARAGALQTKRFKAMDKDGDDKVSRAEFQGPAPVFDRLDADKDGFLTEKENARRPGMLGGGASGRGRFQAMDRDKDGKVSPEEFRGRRPAFDRLDAGKDGFLTEKELEARRPELGKARNRDRGTPDSKSRSADENEKGKTAEKPKVSEEDKAPEKAKSPSDK